MNEALSLVISEESASIIDAKVASFHKRRKDAPPRVNSTSFEDEGEGVIPLAKYAEAMGSISDDFRTLIFAQIGALAGRIDRNTLLNSALAMLNSFKPRNEIEATLVTEIFMLHTLVAEMVSRVMPSDNPQQVDSCVNRIDKLSRAVRETVATLQKLRGEGSQQKVIVEHVHVHKGGQAIVGSVNRTGGEGEKP